MSKPKVLVTRPLFREARAILDEHFDADYWTAAERIPRAELLKRVADKDALVCLLTEKVDEELLAAVSRSFASRPRFPSGYDNIDVPACTRHKVLATHTPGVLDETTADFAWTLLMAVARRLSKATRGCARARGQDGISISFSAATFGAKRSASSDSGASAAGWHAARRVFRCGSYITTASGRRWMSSSN